MKKTISPETWRSEGFTLCGGLHWVAYTRWLSPISAQFCWSTWIMPSGRCWHSCRWSGGFGTLVKSRPTFWSLLRPFCTRKRSNSQIRCVTQKACTRLQTCLLLNYTYHLPILVFFRVRLALFLLLTPSRSSCIPFCRGRRSYRRSSQLRTRALGTSPGPQPSSFAEKVPMVATGQEAFPSPAGRSGWLYCLQHGKDFLDFPGVGVCANPFGVHKGIFLKHRSF